MSELEKIAIGLLGMSHPEIYRYSNASAGQPTLASSASPPTQGREPKPAANALRALKFALAALLAGARSIPLGDNGRVTRELGEYGTHLRGC